MPHAMAIASSADDIGLPAAAVEQAAHVLQQHVDNESIHGAVLGIARCGVLHTIPFGTSPPANDNNPPTTGLRDSLPIANDSIFLVASVTKPVTATAVLQLVEGGQLTLDTPVCSIIPEFTGDGREAVTIRHLLTHTSGLPDGIPENQEFRRRHAPLTEFTSRMLSLGLLFEPGSSISYQSAGINLLGEIVHRISGLPLPVYLQQHIFRPLGMQDTT